MKANIFGERLKQARKAANFSLRALAKQVGLSHSAIQKYEKGQAFPSSDLLIKLSNAINISIERLFRPQIVELGPLSFRKKSSLGKKIEQQIEFQLQGLLERRLELENCYPSPPKQVFNIFEVPNFNITDYTDMEKIAIELRQLWELGLDPIYDLIDILENKGIRIVEIDANENSFDGLFCTINNEPIIVIKKISEKWPIERQRFTLAHELGHLFIQKSLPSNLDEEKACNRFAGAFLFPQKSVQQEFGIKRKSIEIRELLLVKYEYGLSMSAIIFRLFQSNIISEACFRNWQFYINKKGWRKCEPGKTLPSKQTHIFEKMVFHALGEEYISEAKAAELLGLTIDLFRNLRLINEQNCFSSL